MKNQKNKGQYSTLAIQRHTSAVLSLNFCVSRNQKCRDSTALLQSRDTEVLYSPCKNLKNLFSRTFQASQAGSFWRISFLGFFRDSTALFNPRPTILGTVQHVCSSGLQKCCTVPKFLVPRHKNLGTVQHFCVWTVGVLYSP